MSKPTDRFKRAMGNMRVEVTTAFGVENVCDAVDRINRRTAWLNTNGADERRYARERAKITMPADITAWLAKEV